MERPHRLSHRLLGAPVVASRGPGYRPLGPCDLINLASRSGSDSKISRGPFKSGYLHLQSLTVNSGLTLRLPRLLSTTPRQ